MNMATTAAAPTPTSMSTSTPTPTSIPNGKPRTGPTVTMIVGGNINVRNPVAVKISGNPLSISGALSPSPNVSVTSSGKRVSGGTSTSRGNNNSGHINNRTKDVTSGGSGAASASAPHKDSHHHHGVNFTSRGNKEAKEINLQGDLRNIMHAFSDGTSPTEEAVQLMEIILRQEMMAFLFICDTAAYWGGAKVLGLRECIYALRNDHLFLSRLFNYLIKDEQQQVTLRANQVGHSNSSKIIPAPKNYYTEIRGIVEELDGTGELGRLLDLHYTLDNDGKVDKDKGRSHHGQGQGGDRDRDSNTRRLISPKYTNYAKARSISFARKLPKLQEWVSIYLHSEFKLNHSFLEVLAFLVYELVAEIVDLSFVVQRERSGGSDPSFKFMDPRGSNPDTCMSGSVISKKDEECNNVSEMLVLASELEAKRLKKVSSTSNREIFVTKSVHCLSSSEIREAYLRMQNSPPPSVSFRCRAEKIKQFNFQY